MDLRKFVKVNLDKITTVQDIHDLPDFNLFSIGSYNFDEFVYNEKELYREMITLKKSCQLTLNLFKSFNEYKNCNTMNFEERKSLLWESPADKYIEQPHENMKLSLIEIICKYIELRQTILAKENQTFTKYKVDKVIDENLESLMSSVCFYCDNHFDHNIEICDMCGADTNDMRDYVRWHAKSLRRKKDKRLSIQNVFSKLIEPVEESISDNSKEMNSKGFICTTLQCNACTFCNAKDKTNCEVCLEPLTKSVHVSGRNSRFNSATDEGMNVTEKEIKLDSTRNDSSMLLKNPNKAGKEIDIANGKNNFAGKSAKIQPIDVLQNNTKSTKSRKISNSECETCGQTKGTLQKTFCDKCTWKCWVPNCGHTNCRNNSHCAGCREENTGNSTDGKMRNSMQQCRNNGSEISDYKITSV